MSSVLSGHDYLMQHDVEAKVGEAVAQILQSRPSDPVRALGAILRSMSVPAPALKRPPVHVKALFAQLDTNSDGVLSFEEAKAALSGKVPPVEYRAVFEKYDEDNNGTLDLAEFVKLCRSLDKVHLSENRSVIDRTFEATRPKLYCLNVTLRIKPERRDEFLQCIASAHPGPSVHW